MSGKILSLAMVAAGLVAGQEAVPKEPEPEKKVDLNVTVPAPKKCSIPLLNVLPMSSSRMPMFKPRTDFVPKAFYIQPPAPPCEDNQPNPLISGALPSRKNQPQPKPAEP